MLFRLNNFFFSNAQLGNEGGGGPTPITQSYYQVPMDLTAKNPSVGGQVMFVGGVYERFIFGGEQKNAMTGMFSGYTESLKFELSQDLKSKLVFALHERTVGKTERTACQANVPCIQQESTESHVLLCEPQ